MIRYVDKEDAKQLVDIYNYYIENTAITFETESIDVIEMENRIKKKTLDNPWIVYEENNKILGYAYVGKFNSKEAFNKTREVTIYVDKEELGKGIGSKLMNELIEKCKEYKFHLLISIITVPNAGSEILHEKFRFKRVGVLNDAGFKMNKLLDVAYWQLKI